MKPHKFDTVSFLAGLVIVGIGLVFLIPREPGDIFQFIGDVGSWFWAVAFSIVGIAILAPLAKRRSEATDEVSET